MIAGKLCLELSQPLAHTFLHLALFHIQDSLDHVRYDTVRLSGTRVVGRHAVPEHLERRVTVHAILGAQLLLFGAVDLGELDALFLLELRRGFLVVRREAKMSAWIRRTRDVARQHDASARERPVGKDTGRSHETVSNGHADKLAPQQIRLAIDGHSLPQATFPLNGVAGG